MICTFTSVLLCELSPVPLQQQVAGQTGFPFDRSLNSADVGPAVMEKGDVREDSVPVHSNCARFTVVIQLSTSVSPGSQGQAAFPADIPLVLGFRGEVPFRARPKCVQGALKKGQQPR